MVYEWIEMRMLVSTELHKRRGFKTYWGSYKVPGISRGGSEYLPYETVSLKKLRNNYSRIYGPEFYLSTLATSYLPALAL